MFKGNDVDGAELYETKEEAIARAKILKAWDGDPTSEIMVHKSGVPLWFAHLVKNTWFEHLAYTKV